MRLPISHCYHYYHDFHYYCCYYYFCHCHCYYCFFIFNTLNFYDSSFYNSVLYLGIYWIFLNFKHMLFQTLFKVMRKLSMNYSKSSNKRWVYFKCCLLLSATLKSVKVNERCPPIKVLILINISPLILEKLWKKSVICWAWG